MLCLLLLDTRKKKVERGFSDHKGRNEEDHGKINKRRGMEEWRERRKKDS
jgi:hypothetical protein